MLRHHQNLVVAERLARHQGGKRLTYSQTTPQALADTLVPLLGSDPAWPAIRTDGARRAAELITTLARRPGMSRTHSQRGPADEAERETFEESASLYGPGEVQPVCGGVACQGDLADVGVCQASRLDYRPSALSCSDCADCGLGSPKFSGCCPPAA